MGLGLDSTPSSRDGFKDLGVDLIMSCSTSGLEDGMTRDRPSQPES